MSRRDVGLLTRWRWSLALCLAGGPAAGALLWGLAVWDTPARIGTLRAVLTLLPSLATGLMAGGLAFLSLAVRESFAAASALLGMVDHVVRKVGVTSGAGHLAVGRHGARWSGRFMLAAGFMMGLDAIFLFFALGLG